MKIVILIPLGLRTGGPEALHQLSDSLIYQEYEASIWYVIESDLEALRNLHANGILNENGILNIEARSSTIEEYNKYKTIPANQIILSRDTCLVVPEIYIELIKLIPFCHFLVWWLSVDNSFGFLSRINMNYLRKSNCFHGYQSIYAKKFLDAINLNNNFPLSDYTPLISNEVSSTMKDCISINAGYKVIFDTHELAQKIKELCFCEVHLLADMSREEIYQCLDKSYIYIDLGSFPGKDRMPREALLRGACVFVAKVGAGLDDFSLPKEFCFDINDLDNIPFMAKHVIDNFEFYEKLAQPAITKVKNEELVFNSEVCSIMNSISNR